MKRLAAAAASLLIAACGGEPAGDAGAAAPQAVAAVQEQAASLDVIGAAFVRLALGLGVHDPAFVDAYHGPAEWAEDAKTEARSLDDLKTDAQGLLISVRRANEASPSVRGAMLEKEIRAALARIRMHQGERLSFDEETRLVYDVVAPQYDLAAFDAALAEIDRLLPGAGPLADRVDAFRTSLAIPEDKLGPVFDAAIAECRARTAQHYDLPETERFALEFVKDKPWSGYNWYQGDYQSLIEVNTDFPTVIDRAVDLGCHEGYPGHHVWNIYLERDLLNAKGWIEYSVYPLFSPLSVIAEGSANYGIELAFPRDEKIAFERDVLFPLAGLDPAKAETLDKLNVLRRRLSHADNYVAREYLDGRIGRDEAIDLIQKYKLEGRARSEQRVRFIETYRGYVLNYNVGRDLVENYVSGKAVGRTDTWAAFETLLTTPLAASDLAKP